jgi:acyl carrier protein
MPELYITLAEILEVDSVKPTDRFRDFPAWDSLAILSIIATIGAQYGVYLTAAELQAMVTVEDMEKRLTS